MRNLSLVFVLVLSCLLATPAAAARVDSSSLEEQKARAAAARKALEELTAQERAAHKDLAEAEQRIKELQERIDAAEQELSFLRASEKDVAQTLETLESRKGKSLEELRRLLQNLWPVQIRREVLRGRTLPEWEQADREFVWMAAVYSRVQRSLDELQQQETVIRTTLEEKRRLAEKARKRLAAVNQDKDELLDRRIEFRRELAAVREKKLDQQEELDELLAILDELNYKLEKQEEARLEQRQAARQEELRKRTRVPFQDQKGKLPWPVEGAIAVGYAPTAKNASRGLGFSLAGEVPVHAVSWGRVVHNEVLRGFGRVVILLHGDDYYSVYAFLSSSDLEKGQEVVQDEVIGRAGYYPRVKGPGVYFELRFHQKPINPRQWLIARK